MKQSINQTIFLITFILLLPGKNILFGGSQPISKQKAWANFKPLIASKETKRILKITEMDSTVKKYYNNCKARADREFPGNFEVYEISKTNGTVSVDTQYIATVKSVFLSPRVDGAIIETHTDEQFNLPLYDELTFMDADLKVLWKKTFDWGNKARGNIHINKVFQNGKNIFVSLPDTNKIAKRNNEYPEIHVVYDNKGNEVFSRAFGDLMPIPDITNNGKYLLCGEPIIRPYKEDKWKIINLETGDSALINIPLSKAGKPQIQDDGRILIVLASGQKRLRWLQFDSLKLKPWRFEK